MANENDAKRDKKLTLGLIGAAVVAVVGAAISYGPGSPVLPRNNHDLTSLGYRWLHAPTALKARLTARC